jgi:hypothetical protein
MYISYHALYETYLNLQTNAYQEKQTKEKVTFTRTIDLYNAAKYTDISSKSEKTYINNAEAGFHYLAECRKALEALDRCGWERSYHQKLFHDNFLRACAKIFWKTCKAGDFEKCHEKILESNQWDSLRQEILVSTPRRFGKTISVSMFAAAMLYSAPKLEMSIYSTCKRISQKLLLNVQKFLSLIQKELQATPMKIVRQNMEEIVLLGDNCEQDFRIVNSYPSKVSRYPRIYVHVNMYMSINILYVYMYMYV